MYDADITIQSLKNENERYRNCIYQVIKDIEGDFTEEEIQSHNRNLIRGIRDMCQNALENE